MNKSQIRKEKLKLRDNLSNQEREAYSREICNKLFAQTSVIEAKCILCYVNFRSEVQTVPFIKKCMEYKKIVFCPRVKSDGIMDFYQISSLADLKEGNFGILEPDPCDQNKWNPSFGPCVMILPGSAFDRSGNRIGYGGGYYDRFLENDSDIQRIGICYEVQITDYIETESNDMKVDVIITENEVIEIV